MNDEKHVLKLAAERLLAVANGATLEWVYDNTEVVTATVGIPPEVLGGDKVRIRPPAVAPFQKPSQEWFAKRKIEIAAGPMTWAEARENKAYRHLQAVCLHTDGRGNGGEWMETGLRIGLCGNAGTEKLTYIVRPIAATLTCPPRPTPDQVAAARMPDGRRVKEPTVCEVPNGRAWFTPDTMEVARHPFGPDCTQYDSRRWIAEPADEVVEPWTLDTVPMPLVVKRRRDGKLCTITCADHAQVGLGGAGGMDYAALLRDYVQRDGQPCGVAK